MLKQRLITAAILVPLVVWAILALNTGTVLLLFAGVALLAGWEWLQLMDIKSTPAKLGLLALAFAAGWSSLAYLPFAVILFGTVMLWLLATLVVVFYAAKPLAGSLANLFKSSLFGFFVMLVTLTGFVASAGYLHSNWEQGPALLLFVMVTVWLADTGGYFAGKRLGKHKLAEAISPNKTWEGVLGAQLLALIWAVGFYFSIDGLNQSLGSWLLLTFFIVMVSVVGDLLESVFKRCYDKKDSGQLLPGHGGILDRVDSLLAALPVFTVSLLAGVWF